MRMLCNHFKEISKINIHTRVKGASGTVIMAESSYDGGQEGKGRGQSFNESFTEKLGDFRKFASTSFTRAKQVNQGGRWDRARDASSLPTHLSISPVHY